MFLLESDYKKQIKTDALESIIQNHASILTDAELATIEEMSSYLRERFDCALIFSPVLPYDEALIYPQDIRVLYQTQIYQTINDTEAGELPNASPNYQLGDNRNALIVMYAIDILLYHIHSRLAGYQVPEIRIIRYEAALKWVQMAGNGKIVADLPLLPSTETVSNFRFGSNPKRQHNY